MSRNWLTAFRDASFRGVPFKVAGDGPTLGRRVAVNEISGGDNAVTEDMGRAQTEFRVDAYVAGDDADQAGHALERACDAYGPSLLILPMDAGRLVHCVSCQRNRDRDRAGFIGYDLDFVLAGSAGAVTGGLATLRSIFDAGLSAAAGAFG